MFDGFLRRVPWWRSSPGMLGTVKARRVEVTRRAFWVDGYPLAVLATRAPLRPLVKKPPLLTELPVAFR